jgi:sugar lactone lactonase YvrE
MVVDSRGRAYAGNFGFDLDGGADPVPAVLVRVDPDGTVAVVADELLFPNGSVITPDERTLIVGETAGCRYTAFTIADDGSLSDRRVWAQLGPTPELTTLHATLAQMRCGPDGCTLDAEGHIWAADEVTARCLRIAPGGEIGDEIAMPAGLDCFACMLGGDDGRTLLICAAPDFDPVARAATHEAVHHGRRSPRGPARSPSLGWGCWDRWAGSPPPGHDRRRRPARHRPHPRC